MYTTGYLQIFRTNSDSIGHVVVLKNYSKNIKSVIYSK